MPEATDVPAMIDGSPAEVEAIVLEQLPATIDAFAAFVDDVARQLANTERSRIVAETPTMDAAELSEAYTNSDRAGQLVRLVGAAKAMCAVTAQLVDGRAS